MSEYIPLFLWNVQKGNKRTEKRVKKVTNGTEKPVKKMGTKTNSTEQKT